MTIHYSYGFSRLTYFLHLAHSRVFWGPSLIRIPLKPFVSRGTESSKRSNGLELPGRECGDGRAPAVRPAAFNVDYEPGLTPPLNKGRLAHRTSRPNPASACVRRNLLASRYRRPRENANSKEAKQTPTLIASVSVPKLGLLLKGRTISIKPRRVLGVLGLLLTSSRCRCLIGCA